MALDAGLPVRAFFTTRDGGVSVEPYDSLNLADHVGDLPAHVDLNRAAIAEAAGAEPVFVVAEHGATVHHVSRPDAVVPPADILVTDVAGIALVALAADCVPLLLHDGASGAVVAAHIGRQGLWKGAVDAAVAALLDRRPARASRALIFASVGPAICGQCYEVPAEMRREIAERHPTAFSTTRWGTPALDIPRAVETRLGELGIGQVVRVRACTHEEAQFFSHRRDGVTGRQAGVVVCGVSLLGGPSRAT
ncbi:polyphenol oxidase family protein [Demequina sp.]|uniref:polyphenol oxidase family protein n=1 Tax=Demequina sp. TaxID=2050685 RepID=UPI003D1527A6